MNDIFFLIIFRTHPHNLVLTNLFDVPWLTTEKFLNGASSPKQDGDSVKTREKRLADEAPPSEEIINLSDHEAVTASLMLFKKKPIKPSN